MKRIIIRSAVAAVCLFCLLSVGCQTDPGASSKDPTAAPVAMLSLDERYQLLRSDTASADVSAATKKVSTALQEQGVNVTPGTDWINRKGEADYPEKTTEILVGRTNRQESIDVYALLKPYTYRVQVVGEKLVVVGSDDFCTCRGVEYLLSAYLNAGAAVPEDLCYVGECDVLYVYTVNGGKGEQYDDTVTAAALQGLFNRYSPRKLYLTSKNAALPSELLSTFSQEGRWLADTDLVKIADKKELLKLAAPYIKAAVIWDPNLPATLNVGTTAAGAEDGVLLTGTQYENVKNLLPADVKVVDLRGKFAAKNDAYRWAIDEYLVTGRCNWECVCSFADSFQVRGEGNVSYAVCRDWAVCRKAFVFDLSVWEDEAPKDDRGQKPGTDKATMLEIYRTVAGNRPENTLTEIVGFFPQYKYADAGNDETFTSAYKGTQFEWEMAYLFTAYGFYWSPDTGNAYNMTVHSSAAGVAENLQQNRPGSVPALSDSEDNVYVLLVMGDYDSAGSLCNRMYANWQDEGRGSLPLAWSFNPTLLEQYPDLIAYFYETATANDYFVSNAGAAGWFTPSRVTEADWPLYVAQCKRYFALTDISCAPDFWDYQTFTAKIENYIGQFADTGMGALISNQLKRGTGKVMTQHLSADGIPVDPLYNAFDRVDAAACGKKLAQGAYERERVGHAAFLAVRVVWVTPTYLEACVESMQKSLPGKTVTVLDPYTYYAYLAQSLSSSR